LAPYQSKTLCQKPPHLAHGGVVGLVGVQFLLDQMRQVDGALKVGAEAHRRVLAQGGAHGGDLLGDALHVATEARLLLRVEEEAERVCVVQAEHLKHRRAPKNYFRFLK